MMILFLYLIVIVLMLFSSVIVLNKKRKQLRVDYSFLYQNFQCDLHKWERNEEFGYIFCRVCNLIAGNDVSNTEEVEFLKKK